MGKTDQREGRVCGKGEAAIRRGRVGKSNQAENP
jgi:hypothetical protein